MNTNTNTRTMNFRLVTSFAGIRRNRCSSPYERFADANRAAMAVCAEKKISVEVFVFDGGAPAEVVASYRYDNGVFSIPVT